MSDYSSIKQVLEDASNQDQDLPHFRRKNILELSKNGPLQLDASLTDWTYGLVKKRKFVKRQSLSKSPEIKKNIILPKVYDYLNRSLPKIESSLVEKKRAQSQNTMCTNKQKNIADIRRIDILGQVMLEQKSRDCQIIPKTLKKIKIFRSKNKKNPYQSVIQNPEQFSLFSHNYKLDFISQSPAKEALQYLGFTVSHSNLLNY